MLAALLLAAMPTPDLGTIFRAGALRDRCKSAQSADITYCFAYVAGAYDTVRAYESWLNLREFCVPAGTSQSELRDAFVSYVDQNPGYIAGEAASVVVVALKSKYPCSAKAPDKSRTVR